MLESKLLCYRMEDISHPSRRRVESGLLRRFKMAVRDAIMSTGINLHLNSHGRSVLEKVILPYYAQQSEIRTVLFIGCEWYTRGYRRFFREREYWTLDIDPTRSRYGCKLHIVDSLANIEAHFHGEKFDLIICNGVFGWGLDKKSEVEKAFRGCHECLSPDGTFILGWNNLPERTPFPLEESESLKLFRRNTFPPLGVSRLLTPSANRHIYDFYVKSDAGAETGDEASKNPSQSGTSLRRRWHIVGSAYRCKKTGGLQTRP